MLKKLWKLFTGAVFTVLILFILILAASFLPLPGNFKAFVVQSGSMEPTVKTGSLIFVKPAQSYEVGDIINMVNGKSSVTHRIVTKKTENGTTVFETKGDANEEADVELTPQSKVFGKMLFGLPYAGYPVAYAKTQKGFLLLVIIPSVIIIYEELRKLKDEALNMLAKKGNKAKEAERVPEEIIASSVPNTKPKTEHVLDLRLMKERVRTKKRVT